MITIYRSWEWLERHDALSAYTRTVMVRLFIDERHRHRWTRELLHGSLPEPEPAAEEMTQVGDMMILLKALSTLSAQQRSLVYLPYWEDLSSRADHGLLSRDGPQFHLQSAADPAGRIGGLCALDERIG